jgi:hypothetical protein
MHGIDWNKTALIAGILASVANVVLVLLVWLTLREMANQRKSAYRPDIVLVSPALHIYWKKEGHNLSLPYFSTLMDRNNFDDPASLFDGYVEVFNVGLGTAKAVNFAWSFDIDDLVQWIQGANSTEVFQIDYKPSTYLHFETKQGGSISQVMSLNHSYTYLLPTHVQVDAAKIPLPSVYLLVGAAGLYLQWLNGDLLNMPAGFLPALTLKASYTDIGKNTHEKCFSFQPQLGHFSEGQGKEQILKALILFEASET